ncbi:MAG TPA: sn-glycerol-3-phosphate ABC transporter substrate-binding protein UgpB [Acetobacteraceae bacterium]
MTIPRRAVLAAFPAALAAPHIARAADRTKVILWHAMAATPGAEINKLIDKFNAGQNQIEVTGLFKGVYKDLMTAVAAAWRAGEAPHIAQVFEVGTETMMSSGPVIKPVWRLAQETGVKLDPNAYIPAVRGYYSSSDGKLVSMPFNSSTCICWYNQDAFAKAGLDPDKFPATWPELVTAARTLRDKQGAQYPVITGSVVWAHFEQFSAIHNLPYATEANGFNGLNAELKINSPAHVRNLQRLLDMSKEGTFHYTGRDGSGDGAFLSGQSGVDFTSSAERGDLVRSAKFRWAPAFLPYDPEVIKQPINSVIGGASFWVLTAPKRSSAEYHAVAEFLQFLAQPDNDAEWSEVTGYVPITQAGFDVAQKQGWLEKNPGADIPIRQLRRGHVTENSRGFHLGRMPEIRTIIEEECEKALGGQQDAKHALDSAVARGNKVLRDFQHSVRT